jgi:hypothetical protein
MSIYTGFTPDDIVEANPTVVTTGLWSNDTGSYESAFFVNTNTGQQVGTSAEYYLDLYGANPTSNTLAEVQFSIAYGHINGGGSPTLTENELATLPTKAIYSQYKNLLLDPADTRFSFQGVDSDHIYVINFQRARIREQLDPGNWELPLSGTNGALTFIDDSGQTLGALTANSKAGRVFNVVSGALSTVSGSISSSTNATTWGTGGPGYGLVYPDLGIIVLNPNAIGPAVGFYVTSSALSANSGSAASGSNGVPFYTTADVSTATGPSAGPYAAVTHSLTETAWGGSKSAYNHFSLFTAINKATSATSYDKGFRARSAETISSTHYFVRLRNKQYNYSNNPTFYNPDNGALVQSDFKNSPQVYVTTIGLYNTENELLAVAKLSKPVRKSFDEEVLLRVRLDY